MSGIVLEDFHVVMSRITRRAQAAADRWTAADLQDPRVDRLAVDQAMQRYLAGRGERARPLHWFADGTSARAHIRARARYEPKPAYWPSITIANALDLAWFAGAMRPPISIRTNWLAATVDWENWICAVTRFNTALTSDRASALPPELQPIADGFPEPPDAGRPVDDALLAVVLAEHPAAAARASPAIHPERLWTPLIEAFAGGLYFYWIGPAEVVCIPRPALWLSEGRLHRENGPAVSWASGERHFFIQGAEVAPTGA